MITAKTKEDIRKELVRHMAKLDKKKGVFNIEDFVMKSLTSYAAFVMARTRNTARISKGTKRYEDGQMDGIIQMMKLGMGFIETDV